MRKQAILFGNGLNRLIHPELSWENLTKDFGDSINIDVSPKLQVSSLPFNLICEQFWASNICSKLEMINYFRQKNRNNISK